MKATTFFLAFLLLAGCAAMSADTEPKEPPSQVSVYREPSSRDSLFPMLFAVDGRPVVQLQPGETYGLELPAGDHEFQYQLGLYNCSERVRLETGKPYVFLLAQGCVIALENRP